MTTLTRATVSRVGHGNVASRGNVTHVATLVVSFKLGRDLACPQDLRDGTPLRAYLLFQQI